MKSKISGSKKTKPKVIVIGLDGATWNLIKPWISKGKLPTFRKLIEHGAWGNLTSTIPSMSPPAWATIMTGVCPDKHKIYSFFHMRNGQPHIVNLREINYPKIWQVLDSYGYKQIIMNVPLTYPPDKINGFFISGFLTPSLQSSFTYPKGLKYELLKENYLVETDPREWIGEVRWKILRKDLNAINNMVSKYNAEVEIKLKILVKLMDRIKPNFVFVCLTSPDRIQHYLINFPEQVLSNYCHIDKFIDKILSLGYFDHIILLSDHGFSKIDKVFHINSFLLHMGYLTMDRNKLFKQFAFYILTRIVRSLIKKGIPLENLPNVELLVNKMVLKDIRHINKAKCIFDRTTGIDINISDQKCKIVTKNRLIADMSVLRDTNGEKFVEALPKEQVYPSRESATFPDIFLRFKKGYSVSPILIPPFIMNPKNFLLTKDSSPMLKVGDHISAPNGIFLMYGKGVINKRIEAKVEDIFPTLLHIFGKPIPKHVDGKVILEAFR